MINRSIEKEVIRSIKTAPVTLLTGPRQTGKTTLLKYLLSNKSFNYVSLDENEMLIKAKQAPKDFLSLYPYPLIIDEVQKAPELLAEINAIVNKSKVTRGNEESNGMYILSGSNQKILLEKSSESLCGRMLMLDMWPLSVSEIYGRNSKPFSVDDINDLRQRANQIKLTEMELFDLILKGFLPRVYNSDILNRTNYYTTYINSFLEKDLYPLIDIKDHIKFYEFLKSLASNIGQELVYDNYAKVVGVSSTTIKSWIDILVKCKFIYLIKPYNELSFIKRMVKRPKLYFFDTGIAAHLIGIDSVDTLVKSFLKGRFFENFVVNEIMKSYQNAGLPFNFYYYRDVKQHEVDLVYLSKGKINCIEIKCGNSFSLKDIKAAKQLKASKFELGKKIIISSGNDVFTFDDDNDFIIIPAVAI